MADDRPETTRPSWKRGARPAKPAEPSKHAWSRRNRAVSLPREPRTRAFKLIAAVTGFVAFLAAALIIIFILSRQKPVGVVLAGADYADNLAVPQNALGWAGLEKLDAILRSKGRWALIPPASFEPLLKGTRRIGKKGDWDKLIAELAKVGRLPDTILIVLALHGVTDDQGAYLLPDDASGPEDRIPLADVIASVRRLRTKNAVLVLDGSQVPADPRRGMLLNEFADRLQELEGDLRKDAKLWVLSACGPGQRSWASEGLGSTAFLHYLTVGLQGKAADANGRLTLAGLQAYLRRNVSTWAQNARGEVQEPMLLPGRAEGESDERPSSASSSSRPSSSSVALASLNAAGEDATPSKPSAAGRNDLLEAWGRFGALDRLVPHPTVYAPRRWREYRAVLVRYEELVRAGVTRSGVLKGLADRLRDLEGVLREGRILKTVRGSMENSLAMSAVRGGRAEATPPTAPEFGAFFRASDTAAEEEWRKLADLPPSDAEDLRPLRVRVADALVRRAASSPSVELPRAAAALGVSGRGTTTPPVEAHVLRMLHRSLAPGGDDPRPASPFFWKTAGLALSTRRAAERAALGLGLGLGPADRPEGYHYTEQVQPWIRPAVAAADQARRLGEDRLFASSATVWTDAERDLKRASEGYETASNRAATVREALAVRDRLLAELPDYSRWLARLSPNRVDPAEVQALVELWGDVHTLAEQLDDPRDETIGAVGGLAKQLEGKFDALVARFRERKSALSNQRDDTVDWLTCSVGASVPFDDADGLRQAFWDRLDVLRGNDQTLAEKPPPTAAPDDKRRKAERERRLVNARTEGRLAVAALGARWFDDPESIVNPADPPGDLETTQERLDPKRDADPVKGLRLAGRSIAERWRTLTDAAARLSDESNGVPDDLAAFQKKLAKADRLGRMTDAAAPALAAGVVEPSARRRDARTFDLLLWMAERAWLDHWYAEDERNRPPYFRSAGLLFVKDALSLFPGNPAADQMRKKLEGDGAIKLVGPERLVWTSERNVEVPYDVAATRILPAGIPVVKVDAGPLQLEGASRQFQPVVLTEAGEAGPRATVPFRLSRRLDAEEDFDPSWVRPKVETAALRVTGFFRGHVFELPTEVQLHGLPEVTAIGPASPEPSRAALAIRAEDEVVNRFSFGSGAVAIVLDCSGSMLDPPFPASRAEALARRDTKFAKAKKSLASVLDRLPKGTTVSFWIFGQRRDGLNGDPGSEGNPADVRDYEAPEGTILRIREPAPWDPADLNPLVQRLDQIWPCWNTPLVQAMTEVKRRDLDPVAGPKTLLVLTDGADSEFAKPRNAGFAAGLTIPQFLEREFNNAGIKVNMIFFQVDQKQRQNVVQDFRGITALKPPGRFFMEEDEKRLVEALRQSVAQRLVCEVHDARGQIVGRPLEVAAPNQPDVWTRDGLEPGRYSLIVRGDQDYKVEADLGRGERLIVRLVARPDGTLGFETIPAGRAPRVLKEGRQETKDALLAYQAGVCEDAEGNGFRALVSLDLLRTPSLGGIRQERPRMVWFDLTPADMVPADDPDHALRWREQPFYEGPFWLFDARRWVRDPAGTGLARPVVRGWWDTGPRPAPDALIDLDPTLPLEASGQRKTIRVDGQDVTLEGLRFEDHRIERRPGETPVSERCLVVRIDYNGRDNAVIVDPEGLRLGGIPVLGYEHRLYTRAKKYTGLFWPVTRGREQALKSLGLVSLARFRAQAEKRGESAALTQVLAPQVAGRLPRPPGDIPGVK